MAGTPGVINFREINFDTRDRTPGTTISHPTFSIYQTMKIKQIQVLQAEIPFSWYVFTDMNNKLDFFEPASGPITTITVTPGNYSSAEMISLLKILLDGASPNGYVYTVSIDPNKNRITIASTGAFNILWASGPNNTSNICDELGYEKLDLTGSSTYTAPFTYNMSGPNYIYIKCDQIKGFDNEITNSKPNIDPQIVARIVITENSGSTIYYQDFLGNPTQLLFGNTTVTSLSFKLTDRNNVELDLNGRHWSMLVGIFS